MSTAELGINIFTVNSKKYYLYHYYSQIRNHEPCLQPKIIGHADRMTNSHCMGIGWRLYLTITTNKICF